MMTLLCILVYTPVDVLYDFVDTYIPFSLMNYMIRDGINIRDTIEFVGSLKENPICCVHGRQIAKFLCVFRGLWLSSLSYYFSCQVLFFIRGNSVFSVSRVFHKRDNVIHLNSISFFFFTFIELESVPLRYVWRWEICPTLWSSSSPAIEILTKAWRVLCAGTPLKVSTKKYGRGVTIVSRREGNERRSS